MNSLLAILLLLPAGADDGCLKSTEAVRQWYAKLADGSDQPNLTAFGTVGSGTGPLLTGYRALAPSLQGRLSQAEYLKRFRGVAEVKLLQVQPACTAEEPARVFVEEQRTVAFDGTSALAWYAGVLKLDSQGRITDLDPVKPEDLISLRLGGHMPWRDDPVQVARVRLRCDVRCATEAQRAGSSLMTVIVKKGSEQHAVDLVRLHSGEWLAIRVH